MIDKSSSKTKRVSSKKPLGALHKKEAAFEEAGDSFRPKTKVSDPRKPLVIGITLVIIIAIVAFVFLKQRTSSPKVLVETTVTKTELKDKLNVEFKDPVDGNDVSYSIENDSIAKISYKKTVSDGNEMTFTMRTSYSTEEIDNSIGLDVEFAYTPIMMTVVCDDGSEIPVESKVALEKDTEEMKYMKALWFDNDKYYSMVTDDLVTREDFLQEVNRVIIANHEDF